MGSIVDRFKQRAPEAIHSSKIKKAGCSLNKTSLPNPNIVIDLDRLDKKDDTKCADFLFASDDSGGWIVPIEMKRGAPDLVKSAQQLQASSKIAEDWISGLTGFKFQPLLVSGSLPKAERKNLDSKNHQVRFEGNFYRVLRLKCGSELRQVFN